MRFADSEDTRYSFDFWILAPVLLLLMAGIVLVFSSSFYWAQRKGFNLGPYHYLIAHTLRVGIGVAALIIAYFIPLKILKRFSGQLHLLALASLFMVFLIGHASHGARRWISLASSFSFQPSEIAKFTLIIYLSAYFARWTRKIKEFKKGFVVPFAATGLTAALVAIQPDFSTSLLIFALGISIMFYAGVKIRYLFLTGLVLAVFSAGMYMRVPHVRKRVKSYLGERENYQVTQARIGIAEGKLIGSGIGRGKEKFLYLPFPHTDFIYAVVAEETGFIGASIVLLLFMVLAARGFRTASLLADEPFSSNLAFGLTLMITLYALAHMGVVLGLLPTTGLPLPFVSYGGSALLFNLAAVGLLLRLSSEAKKRETRILRWKLSL